MMDIWVILDQLCEKEKEYRECKEALLVKEDSLYLHADWDMLKKEKGISNQRQREAHIRECTAKLREQVNTLLTERDNLKRTYTALLWMNKSELIDVAVSG